MTDDLDLNDQELDHLRARLTFLVRLQEKLETCTDDVQRGLLNAMRVLAEAGAPSEVIMYCWICTLTKEQERNDARLPFAAPSQFTQPQ